MIFNYQPNIAIEATENIEIELIDGLAGWHLWVVLIVEFHHQSV